MTTCELRKKAAQVIQERGWHKGQYEGIGGGVCLLGACNVASHGTPRPNLSTTQAGVRSAVTSMGFINPRIAADWNDSPERTQAEVIARLLNGCEGGEDR